MEFTVILKNNYQNPQKSGQNHQIFLFLWIFFSAINSNIIGTFATLKTFYHKIGLLLCHSYIELRLWLGLSWLILRLRLIWTWGWNEVEIKLSGSLVKLELRLSWDKLTLNKGRNLTFIGVGLWFKYLF